MRQYAHAALTCLAIVACLAFFWLVLGGCAASPTPAWSPAYDADWRAACDCWGVEPRKPYVIVRDDCEPTVPQMFRAGGKGDWVYGHVIGNQVEVCPDLAALRHEFSHYVSGRKRHGGGGCFGVE